MEQLLVLMGSDQTGQMFTVDALRIEGQIWLVPGWNEHPTEGWKTPVRMIRIDQLPHQQTQLFGHDLLLPHPIPTAVLTGQIQSHAGIDYEVRDAPEVQIPVKRSTQA